jgi:hypothetical protein
MTPLRDLLGRKKKDEGRLTAAQAMAIAERHVAQWDAYPKSAGVFVRQAKFTQDASGAPVWDVDASPGIDLSCHVLVDDATGSVKSSALAKGTRVVAQWPSTSR